VTHLHNACMLLHRRLCTQSASEMTYIVSGGALNSTHSLTPLYTVEAAYYVGQTNVVAFIE